MSAKTDTGGDAFPNSPEGCEPSYGMTLLDHFAGLAMQAHISRIGADEDWPGDKTIAEWAYDNAAAMVAEKRRREGK